MRVTKADIERAYAEMSDQQFALLKPEDLGVVGQECYRSELARRGAKSQTIQKDDSINTPSLSHANFFMWPQRCACCGAASAARVKIVCSRNVGGMIETFRTTVPCCKHCQRHQHVWMELPASLFIIPIGAIVAMVFIDSLRFSPQVPTVGTVIGAAFGCLIVLGGLALLVKAIHAMVAKGQNCAARTAFAGVVKGRSEVQFLFANPEFAKEFARLNPGVKVQCRRLSII